MEGFKRFRKGCARTEGIWFGSVLWKTSALCRALYVVSLEVPASTELLCYKSWLIIVDIYWYLEKTMQTRFEQPLKPLEKKSDIRMDSGILGGRADVACFVTGKKG